MEDGTEDPVYKALDELLAVARGGCVGGGAAEEQELEGKLDTLVRCGVAICSAAASTREANVIKSLIGLEVS